MNFLRPPEVDLRRARLTALPFGAVVGLGKTACMLASPRSISGLISRCCSRELFSIGEAVFDFGYVTFGRHPAFRDDERDKISGPES
ncbi:unnamed protein product [Schistocephalus solidus]|uniref:Uncharacterized protein n=1 Tax=Schistocephalus solidus TaxID=70667 RepID=A0A183TGE2_SCHSO|nr:unnamed protein product [Schistocephalus solidus]